MDTKTILITGIGGNVAQGIIRNINTLNYKLKIIGSNISEFSAGNHLCEKVYLVPYAYENSYISEIQNIIIKENIDLIIPTTDYEVFYLAKNQNLLSAKVIACDVGITEIFLDKYKTYLSFKKNNIPFAKTWLVRDYDGSETEIIAKPKEGRGSKGILYNPIELSSLSDDYVIQKLHKGKEITTAIYVDRSNNIHGIFSLERKLSNGATTEAIVNSDHDEKIFEIVKKMIKLGGIKGSINLQSIIDENGDVFPFEVNCRISGTNSIRHCFGFQDVKYTLQEYLFNEILDPVEIKEGQAVRIMMDVIYPNLTDIKNVNAKSTFFIH